MHIVFNAISLKIRRYEKDLNFFHCPIKICKRSLGRSAVAASAYINRTRLENTWDGTIRDYTRKGGLVYSEVMLPANAPPQYADRSVL